MTDGFGDAFDAHDLAQTYQRLMVDYAQRRRRLVFDLDPAIFTVSTEEAERLINTQVQRALWPDLPNDLTAHDHRRWLDTLTVGDAEFLHSVGIDPLR